MGILNPSFTSRLSYHRTVLTYGRFIYRISIFERNMFMKYIISSDADESAD